MSARLKPLEAVRLARKLGWSVTPRKVTGELLFDDHKGRRFTMSAPGRIDVAPRPLTKALLESK